MYIYRRCIHVSSYNLSDVQEIYTRSLINKHYKSKTMDAFVVCVSFVEFMLHFFLSCTFAVCIVYDGGNIENS